MVWPSRDHAADTSSAGSKVNRDAVPLFRLWIHTSTFLSFKSVRSTATNWSSDERDGFASPPTSPTRPNSFPARSNHVSADTVEPALELYTTVPFSAAVKAPQYVDAWQPTTTAITRLSSPIRAALISSFFATSDPRLSKYSSCPFAYPEFECACTSFFRSLPSSVAS